VRITTLVLAPLAPLPSFRHGCPPTTDGFETGTTHRPSYLGNCSLLTWSRLLKIAKLSSNFSAAGVVAHGAVPCAYKRRWTVVMDAERAYKRIVPAPPRGDHKSWRSMYWATNANLYRATLQDLVSTSFSPN